MNPTVAKPGERRPLMARFANAFGPHAPDATYVAHGFDEQLFDTGEVQTQLRRRRRRHHGRRCC